MLDEDPAKREAWSAESSALIYTTGTLRGVEWVHVLFLFPLVLGKM